MTQELAGTSGQDDVGVDHNNALQYCVLYYSKKDTSLKPVS